MASRSPASMAWGGSRRGAQLILLRVLLGPVRLLLRCWTSPSFASVLQALARLLCDKKAQFSGLRAQIGFYSLFLRVVQHPLQLILGTHTLR